MGRVENGYQFYGIYKIHAVFILNFFKYGYSTRKYENCLNIITE